MNLEKLLFRYNLDGMADYTDSAWHGDSGQVFVHFFLEN